MSYPNDQGNPAAKIPVYVVGGVPVVPYNATPKGYEQITSLTTAAGLTVPTDATFALVQCEGTDVRWRDDGTDPTASVGMTLYAGQTQNFSGDLSALKFIGTAAGSILNVSYYE